MTSSSEVITDSTTTSTTNNNASRVVQHGVSVLASTIPISASSILTATTAVAGPGPKYKRPRKLNEQKAPQTMMSQQQPQI